MSMNVQTRYFPALIADLLDDEKYPTTTSKEQKIVEKSIRQCYERFERLSSLDANLPALHRAEHVRYIEAALRQLSAAYECLDSSRPWLVYWILNAGTLLGHRFDDDLLDQVVTFLAHCRCPSGGFGGGPGQLAHLAPTYAAVNALCLIGTERALHTIDRQQLWHFLLQVRTTGGAFLMHVGGETDIRGVYCAVAVAKLANFAPADMGRLFAGTVEWIASCQTYEGGIGGAPDLEAHGGYTFCGVAALALLGSSGGCNLHTLMRWSINRQMRYEGGFQGRSNKLVDGCYSFWQGAVMPIVQAMLYADVRRSVRSGGGSGSRSDNDLLETRYGAHLKDPLFDRAALQEYVLICCQRPTGGLVDKPGKPQDMYHTCYTLSGLAVAQHCELDMYPLVVGAYGNEVCATHPLYNIPARCVRQAAEHFQKHSNDLYRDSSMEADGYAAAAADAVAAEVAGLWSDKETGGAPTGRHAGSAATTTASRDSSSRERDSAERSSSSATTGSSSATTTATSVSCTTEEEEEEEEEEDEPSI